jgi:nucleolar MIF4G domain-containing protein 1
MNPPSINNEAASNKKDIKKNKKRKLDIDVDLNEHEGDTLVTDIVSLSKKSKSKSAKTTSKDKSALSKDIKELDARQLEKLAKSNPAFYAMLQEDGVITGGGPGFEEGFDEDEQYIRHYEKKLGLKRKDAGKLASKKSFLDDGLGDLLKGIELGSRGKNATSTPKKLSASSASTSKAAAKSSLSSVDKKRRAQEIESEEESDDLGDSEDEDEPEDIDDNDGLDSYDEELEGIGSDDLSDSGMDGDSDGIMLDMDSDEGIESFDEELEGVAPESEKEEEHFDGSELEGADESGEESDDNEEASEQEVRKSNPKAAPVVQTGKYLPPHLRAAAAGAEAASGASALAKAIPRQNTEELLRLRRQLQGLLNKLSESNIEAILMDIEALYRKYPRAGELRPWTSDNNLITFDYFVFSDSFFFHSLGFRCVGDDHRYDFKCNFIKSQPARLLCYSLRHGGCQFVSPYWHRVCCSLYPDTH